MESSIKELLRNLFDKTEQSDLAEWCDQLCDFYKKNNRHSYSEISEFILSDDGGSEYIYRIIPLLMKVREQFREQGDHGMVDRVTKLIDHIQLEGIRLNYISESIPKMAMDQFMAINNQYVQKSDAVYEGAQKQLDKAEQMNREMNIQIEKSQELLTESFNSQKQLASELDEMEKEMENVCQTAEAAGKKVKNAERESITILGIFAAIVLAFTGGMIFSSSVLENMHKNTWYNAVIVVLCIGFVMYNVMAALFYMLLRIQDPEAKKEYHLVILGNFLFIFLLFVALRLKSTAPETLLMKKELYLKQMQIESEIESLEAVETVRPEEGPD